MDRFKKILKTLFIILSFVLVNVAIDALTGALVPSLVAIIATGDPINSLDYMAYGLFAGQLLKFTIMVFFIDMRNKSYRKFDKLYIKKEKIKEPYKLIGVGLGTIGFGLTLTNLIMKFFDGSELLTSALDLMENAFSGQGTLGNIIILLVVAIGAPLVEELLFRGVLYEELNRNLTAKMTIFLTALVFGIYHFNIIQTPNTFVMGLVLGYLYYKTGSIYAPMIVHATNNIIAMVPIIDQGLTPLGLCINTVLIIIGLYSLKTLGQKA